MDIICNGQHRTLEPGSTLDDLLKSLKLEPDNVVIEINKQILNREQYCGWPLQPGDTLELIRFVGGG